MSFRTFLKSYFRFSRKERHAVMFFLVLIMVLLGMLAYLRYFYKPESPAFDTAFLIRAEDFLNRVNETAEKERRAKYEKPKADSAFRPDSLFAFNPNSLDDSLWMLLVNDSFLVRRIKNYESKGGRFRVKNDVKRIYGFDSLLFEQLKPFILLPDSIGFAERKNGNMKSSSLSAPVLKIDLNDAVMNDLVALKGIGESRATKILEWRHKLGGFHSVEQLKEVYGIDSAVFALIASQVYISAPVFRKINFNLTECRDMLHPYLNRNVCRAINRLRTSGPGLTANDIKTLPEMTDSLWQKLSPYLTFE